MDNEAQYYIDQAYQDGKSGRPLSEGSLYHSLGKRNDLFDLMTKIRESWQKGMNERYEDS